ncbi:MAG: hypothetical protein ACJA06_000343 [Halocynthiibacter sp.]
MPKQAVQSALFSGFGRFGFGGIAGAIRGCIGLILNLLAAWRARFARLWCGFNGGARALFRRGNKAALIAGPKINHIWLIARARIANRRWFIAAWLNPAAALILRRSARVIAPRLLIALTRALLIALIIALLAGVLMAVLAAVILGVLAAVVLIVVLVPVAALAAIPLISIVILLRLLGLLAFALRVLFALSFAQHPGVMLCVLLEILERHPIIRELRIARKLVIFLDDLLRRTAHFALRARTFEHAVNNIANRAIAIVRLRTRT